MEEKVVFGSCKFGCSGVLWTRRQFFAVLENMTVMAGNQELRLAEFEAEVKNAALGGAGSGVVNATKSLEARTLRLEVDSLMRKNQVRYYIED